MTAPTIAPTSYDDVPAPRAPWYRRRRVQAAIGGGVVAAALGAWALTPSTFEMDGAITLTAPWANGSSYVGACTGVGGFVDLGTGTTVTVYDDTGKIVALGALQQGQGTPTGGCAFNFAIPNVPTASDFYQVEVSHRGRVTFTADAARHGGAQLTLTSPSF